MEPEGRHTLATATDKTRYLLLPDKMVGIAIQDAAIEFYDGYVLTRDQVRNTFYRTSGRVGGWVFCYNPSAGTLAVGCKSFTADETRRLFVWSGAKHALVGRARRRARARRKAR